VKFTYIHIPKCAGHSISGAIKNSKCYVFGHRKKSHWVSETVIKSDIYKFTCVRNIWDSLLSQYHYMRSNIDAHKTYKKLALSMDFNEWVAYHRNNQVSVYPISPSYYIVREGKIVVDYIIRFDTLSQDWKDLRSIIGVNRSLRKLNKGKHEPYQEYYNKKSIKIVREMYKKDIKLFKMNYKNGVVGLGGAIT